ncbi:DNA-binding response regulator, OmpR family, contains REC and winged-helix (wHTH) domain [Paramicrobacterium humi]|uniref:DNA-binding response regulator, OmpR family, contains REC and winged-helix (WHTH) domain n=1 Tax=Paramicrobacterium humi TaxID=640635 RepID=A0A1H4NBI0_9MICO|nr:response regulator transcription factor [Microbacterium humi]SEB92138.1 DNA-binding response regulator, OmpR family, contains REC and winged-helix (wHTH) domain [Microbacterium humi]
MQNRRAVVIEDDADIALLLETSLKGAGFDVSSASDGLSGVELVREVGPDVVTLDVGLPGIDGLETSRRIRSFSDAHIVMLTARTDEADVLMGLDAGADDYMTKPFRPRELRARIAAMMRRRDAASRSSEAAASAVSAVADDARVLEHNGLLFNADERTVTVDGRPLTLTRTEFDLLGQILASHNRVRTKSDLVRRLRDDDFGPDSFVSEADERALEVHIGNLRRKLGEDVKQPRWIVTVRGVGYRLAAAQ